MRQVTHSIITKAGQAMIAAADDRLATGVLGYVDAEGRECFCTLGFICNAAADSGSLTMEWRSLKDAAAIMTDEKVDELTRKGIRKIAVYDGVYTGMVPFALLDELDCGALFFQDNENESVSVVNDMGTFTPKQLGARILKQGLWTQG